MFAGDSITEGYPLSELFPSEIVIYNRGISAITSSALLKHLKTQVLELAPRKLFLLIGTNDLGKGIPISRTARNIEKICRETSEYLPEVSIYVLSVYPVNETSAYIDLIGKRRNKDIIDLNRAIKDAIADIKACRYIDLFDHLLVGNNLKENYTYDGLHLSIEGYKAVSERLIGFLKQ